jgi:hypothetical protein
MIDGVKYWDDPERYYSQKNNSVEKMLSSLETCGPTSAIMALDSMGFNLKIKAPGLWKVQPEDFLTLYLNDPRNAEKLQGQREDIDPRNYMGNRIPQYYPIAIQEVFGAKATFEWGASFPKVVTFLQKGNAVMLCLKDPGHFICAVAYNRVDETIIYHDPWPDNKWPERHRKTPGFGRTLAESDFENVQGFIVWFGE